MWFWPQFLVNIVTKFQQLTLIGIAFTQYSYCRSLIIYPTHRIHNTRIAGLSSSTLAAFIKLLHKSSGIRLLVTGIFPHPFQPRNCQPLRANFSLPTPKIVNQFKRTTPLPTRNWHLTLLRHHEIIVSSNRRPRFVAGCARRRPEAEGPCILWRRAESRLRRTGQESVRGGWWPGQPHVPTSIVRRPSLTSCPWAFLFAPPSSTLFCRASSDTGVAFSGFSAVVTETAIDAIRAFNKPTENQYVLHVEVDGPVTTFQWATT